MHPESAILEGRSSNIYHYFEEKSGFSLIELLIALAIFSILSVIIVTFFNSFTRGHTEQMATSDSLQKARGALNYMVEEIKLAGLDPEESGNFNIISASATTLTFDFDTPDPNPAVSPRFDGVVNLNSGNQAERVTYRFANNRLERLENQGLTTTPNPPSTVPEVLVPEIDPANSGFVYLDENNAPTAVLDNIRIIDLNVAVQEDSGYGNKASRMFTARILGKNLIFNGQRR